MTDNVTPLDPWRIDRLAEDDSNLADVTLGELDVRGYGDLSSTNDDIS
jgi:hypothetical protein